MFLSGYYILLKDQKKVFTLTETQISAASPYRFWSLSESGVQSMVPRKKKSHHFVC